MLFKSISNPYLTNGISMAFLQTTTDSVLKAIESLLKSMDFLQQKNIDVLMKITRRPTQIHYFLVNIT